jgi:predicted metal-dependent phosphoesterase TrpH
VGGADLHLHSVHSDGEWTPERLVKAARRAGLAVVALTDHDSIAGLEAMARAGEKAGVRTVSGVELSTWSEADIHLLAYGFTGGESALTDLLASARVARRDRAERMVERLADLGVPVTWDSVMRQAGDGAIGRPHVARALIDAGHAGSFREVFDRWLGDGKPACVDKMRVRPERAIEVVHAAGGVCVAAHPGIRGAPATLDPLVEAGLDGVEVRHPLHGRKTEAAYDEYARSHGLARTGGSDFHGPGGPVEVGTVTAPAEWTEDLLERIERRRLADRPAAEAAAERAPGPAASPEPEKE